MPDLPPQPPGEHRAAAHQGAENPASRSESQGTPARSEPQGTPAPSESQGAPARKEAQGTPAPSEFQGRPACSEPHGVAAPSEFQGRPTCSEPHGVAAPSEPHGVAACSEPHGVAACSEPHGVADPKEPEGEALCPVCLGRGFLRLSMPVGHPQFGQVEPCDACGAILQYRIARFDRHSSRKGHALDQRFQDFSLDGPAAAARKAYNAAVAFAAEPRGWLVIHGPKGNGKSHLAAAIANHLIETRHVPTLFLTAPDLLEALRLEIQDSIHGLPPGRSSLLEAARTVPVLILDDLGAERGTAWGGERIFLLLDYRYRLESPTVLITNEHLEDLPSRIYSRLGDRALSTVVYNPSPDYRWGNGRVTR